MNNYFVYMVRCSDDSIYTGITNDLEKRMKMHNLKKGAKYTRSRTPVKLIYFEKCLDRSQALKREIAIQNLKRDEKIKLASEFTC